MRGWLLLGLAPLIGCVGLNPAYSAAAEGTQGRMDSSQTSPTASTDAKGDESDDATGPVPATSDTTESTTSAATVGPPATETGLGATSVGTTTVDPDDTGAATTRIDPNEVVYVFASSVVPGDFGANGDDFLLAGGQVCAETLANGGFDLGCDDILPLVAAEGVDADGLAAANPLLTSRPLLSVGGVEIALTFDDLIDGAVVEGFSAEVIIEDLQDPAFWWGPMVAPAADCGSWQQAKLQGAMRIFDDAGGSPVDTLATCGQSHHLLCACVTP